MNVNLDRNDLLALVNSTTSYSRFGLINHPLVEKAKYHYVPALGHSKWNNLEPLTDEELYKLYTLCKNYAHEPRTN